VPNGIRKENDMGVDKQAVAQTLKEEAKKRNTNPRVTNLDAVRPASYRFTLNGETHEIREPGIETFILLQTWQDQLAAAYDSNREDPEDIKDKTDQEKWAWARGIRAACISRCCETLDEASILALRESQLNILFSEVSQIMWNAAMGIAAEEDGEPEGNAEGAA
jgi:hypothetical protein